MLRTVLCQFNATISNSINLYSRSIMKHAYYAVANGRQKGIITTWSACEKSVKGFPKARYKKFVSRQEAERYLAAHESLVSTKATERQDSDGGASTSKASSNPRQSASSSTSDVPVVYTDGSCLSNGRGKASSAAIGVHWVNGQAPDISEKINGRQTNNRAEILAVCAALRQALNREWMPVWKKNHWKTSGEGKLVKNYTELKELDDLLSRMTNVRWQYVPAHSGVTANEHVDKLARNAATKR